MPNSQKEGFDPEAAEIEAKEQSAEEYSQWKEKMGKYHLKPNQVIVAAKDPGTAILLSTRDTFKSPWMGIFYTIFVLAAVFHGGNGFWTFLITWGAILSYRSQRKMVNVSYALMLVLLFLGLAAIWGSYWVNLRS